MNVVQMPEPVQLKAITTTPALPAFLTLKEVRKLTTFSKSTIYNKINDGIFPVQILVGLRAVAFIQSEVITYMNALIQGKSNEQIKELIADLVNNREEVEA